MRPILPMLVIAALSVEARALGASLTTSAFNAEIACTTNCNALCKRCAGAACSKDECKAACDARRRAVCSAFPNPEEYGSAGKSAEFRLPDIASGGLLGSPNWVINGLGPLTLPSLPGTNWPQVEELQPVPGAPPPLAPASHPRQTPKAEDTEAPKTRIIDTRSAPLVHPGEEAAGYGLYTYVLLRQSADRDSHFVKDIVETAPSAAGVAPPLRAQIDLMLIPAKPCPTGAGGSTADCAAHLIEHVTGDLNTFYNYDEANALIEELCAHPPSELDSFCRAPIGQGPFLFTYARPVSKTDPIPPPFLFFDFTTKDEAAFSDYVDAYEATLKSDDFTDDSKLKTLQLRILDVYNRFRAAAGPTVEGGVKLIGLIYPSKGKD